MSAEPEDVTPIGAIVNDAGDSVTIGLDASMVHVEVANANREPVEVWLSPSDAARLATLLSQAAGS